MLGRPQFLGLCLLSAVAACAAQDDDDVDAQGAAISHASTFKKNEILTDAQLEDTNTMTAAKVQAFLEKTPYGGKRSVLADYVEDGKPASAILTEAATKYQINPLVMLVRLQMEQGLISKTTAPASTIAIAFGCGCPHAPVCNGPNGSKYRGFANQAECASGTLRRNVDRSTTSTGTVSGWKVGTSKKTSDGISVTPSNGATAALYTYTPWVGKDGGGQNGGASLHWQIWNDFADAVKGTSGADQPASQEGTGGADQPAPTATSTGAGGADQPAPTATSTATSPAPTSTATAPAPTSTATAPAPTTTATTPPAPTTPAPTPAPAPAPSLGTDNQTPPAQQAAEDAQLAGNDTPATEENAPPRSSTRTKSTGASADSEEAPAAKKAASSGCSTSGTTRTGTTNGLLVLASVFASVLAGRRRKSA